MMQYRGREIASINMLEQPEDQEEQLEQSDTSVDPDQAQQQLDELERLHAATDQATAGLETAAPRRTFSRTVSRAVISRNLSARYSGQ